MASEALSGRQWGRSPGRSPDQFVSYRGKEKAGREAIGNRDTEGFVKVSACGGRVCQMGQGQSGFPHQRDRNRDKGRSWDSKRGRGHLSGGVRIPRASGSVSEARDPASGDRRPGTCAT